MSKTPIYQGRKPFWLVTVGCVVSVGLLFGLAWSNWSSSRALNQSILRSFEIQELRARILYLDELLTMSARMAAATGELSWEKRHRENLPLLLKAIDQATVILPDFQGLKQTESANADLDRLEREAFQQLHAGHQEAARALLFGTDYVRDKEIYARGMQALGQQLQLAAEETTRVQQRRALLNVAAALGAIPPLTIGWLIVLYYLRRWRQELLVNHQHLLELNLSLDEKVATRTNELERLNQLAQGRASLESSLSEMNASLRGNLTVAQASEIGLAGVVKYLGAPMGAVFVLAADGLLHRLAAYAYPEDPALPTSFALGNGVVGQAARSRLPIASQPDHERLLVHFGFGAVPPSHILAYPLSANDTLRGVVELCLFQPLTEPETLWVERVAETIANALGFALEREEKRQAEERLSETEQFFRSVLELAPDGLMVTDGQGLIQLANARCEALFGYRRDELIGQPVEMLVPANSHARHTAVREAFQHNPQARTMGSGGELRGQRKDGSLFSVEIGLSPLPTREGEGAQVAISIRDITLEKQQEAELLAAKQKAEEATEAKSMFLANMSHEIRTPMNAIIGLSHLALKTPLNPKQRDYVGKVHKAGTSLLSIINDILDFSKIEAGKLDIESTDFRLDDVISSVTTLTAQKAHDKGLEFLAYVSPQIPEYLLGDPLRLGQVLTNLVNNAVKFTEQGEIRMSIELLERSDEKVQLQFLVSDTGLGMSPEQAGKLFQPFSQADMSTTRKHGGTGLGLTICRRLVELMGGRVWLESEAGAGSTFYFTVWLGVGVATGSGKIFPEQLAQLRVLVVDDNATACEILQEPLSSIVSYVKVVASGPEAISAVKAQDPAGPFDIVFMDWRMPGMDGLQTSRHIKSDETLSKMPAIVLVTAFGREEVREEAERLQLDGFLVKPVTKSMLVDTLVNVFGTISEEAVSGSAQPQEDAARLLGVRILLAEDNQINQQIAVELLEGVGAGVTVANDGREAVEQLLASPGGFDIVLMDLQMPHLDGYQATAMIRADARFANLPLIAMTAHATFEERQRCLAAGMNDHVSKPVDPEALFQTVARHSRPLATVATTAPAAAAVRSQADPGVPEVEGLDSKDGLARVAGNGKLYAKLLRLFLKDQGSWVERTSAALSQGDGALAELLAHTLKGVAGNIGAKSVQDAAGELETLIREGAGPAETESALRLASTALEPLLVRLQSALPAPEPTTPSRTSMPEDLARSRAAAAQLLQLLLDGDFDSVDFLEKNHADLLPLLPGEFWGPFEKSILNYDFEEAHAQLEKAVS